MKLGYYIRNISRDAVVDGVKNIKRYHISTDKIISDRNPLIIRGAESVIKHGDRNYTFNIRQSQINTFLAASSLSHMLDGWTYLSNAFNAILSGDEATAIHLSYYAELRSAMSILASEGLGVFSTQHIGAFSPTTNREFPTNRYRPIGTRINDRRPTHQFTWEAMEKWSSSTAKPNAEILKIFKVQGRDFYELTEHFHPTTAGSTLLTVNAVKGWLKDWCLDIKLYQKDRDNRNEVSYRPQRIKNFDERINFQSMLNNLEKYWSVISPSAVDRFSLLDRYLLRKLYSSLYSNIATTSPKIDLIRNAFNQHGINNESLFSFLDFQAPYEDDHIIFSNANIRNRNSLSILARATLLLRISIGLVEQLYIDGGMTKADLSFVWENYGVESGFWENTNTPVDFTNLWFDIQPYFNDMFVDINSAGAMNDLSSIKQRHPEGINYFGQIHRASLWGTDF